MLDRKNRLPTDADANQSARFAIDCAKRLIARHDKGLPVNRDELRKARALLKGNA